ncbi:WD40-repeat-containing domain protein [Haematococcus lacustris]
MAEERATFDLPEASNKEKLEQEKLLHEYELKRKAKTIVVPTDDGKVKQMLRQLKEPITLFGEKEMERRERLRRLLAQQEAELAEAPAVGQVVVTQLAPVQTEKFYTEGSEALKAARTSIALWSLQRAAVRLAAAKRRRDDEETRMTATGQRLSSQRQAKLLAQQSSEIGDERPISSCQFSPEGTHLATCGWGGVVAVWAVEGGCSRTWAVRAHEERCTDVAWHPEAVQDSLGSTSLCLASASADASARLLDGGGKLLHKLEGHTERLARLAWHPMARHLGTASFDQTWRLWDVETGRCLLEQEGHSRAVYCLAFHPDGSLAASAGLDAIGRVWDCRTGRSVHTLEGHIKQVLALDFSPNGYHLVSGSDDHTCKVWDLRSRKCLYTLPAHRSLISSCGYERCTGGAYLVTGGYDCLIKIWSSRDFSLLKTLAGHEGKVMAVDSSPAPGKHQLASVSYDRTIKLWSPDSNLSEDAPKEADVDMQL